MRNIAILFATALASSPAMAKSVEQGNLVIVRKATLGCPKPSDMQRALELSIQGGMVAGSNFAERQGCRQIAEGVVGVVEKSGRPGIIDCLRPDGESNCFWIARLRLAVVERVDYNPFEKVPPVKRQTNEPAGAPFPTVTGTPDTRFPVGTQVKVKLPALACPNPSDFRRIVELTIEKNSNGLQKFGNTSGCRQFPMGTVAAVEKEDNKQKMVCIRPRNEMRCLWTAPSVLLDGVN